MQIFSLKAETFSAYRQRRRALQRHQKRNFATSGNVSLQLKIIIDPVVPFDRHKKR